MSHFQIIYGQIPKLMDLIDLSNGTHVNKGIENFMEHIKYMQQYVKKTLWETNESYNIKGDHHRIVIEF
jgi:hypothetical protein